MEDMISIVGFLFDACTQIFNTYTSTKLLASVLALWVVRRVVKVFLQL